MFRTGIGPEKATETCKRVLARKKLDLVISSGFAGALTPSKIGSIVIATQVVMELPDPDHACSTLPISCDSGYREKAFRIGQSLDDHVQIGPVVTVPRILGRATEKQHLAERTGGISLDMESAAVGRIAADCQIPFLMVRTISDLVDEDLPVDFNLFLYPTGWVRGLTAIALNPRCWIGFSRLRRQMIQASHQLTRFFQLFFEEGKYRQIQDIGPSSNL